MPHPTKKVSCCMGHQNEEFHIEIQSNSLIQSGFLDFRGFHGFFPVFFHNCPFVFPSFPSKSVPKVFSKGFTKESEKPQWFSNGFLMGFLFNLHWVFSGLHMFFPWSSHGFLLNVQGPARCFPIAFSASQATFWPVKLHRVVVVRASDWEALGEPRGRYTWQC